MSAPASKQSGEYPRPQLVREQWESLDGEWEFAFDDPDVGLAERWWETSLDAERFPRKIRVPFTFEAPLSGIGDREHHRVVWYRRSFASHRKDAERLLLHFGAVDHFATVWVDGQRVGDHRGGQTAFSFDVTDALAVGDEHLVVVRAEETVSTDVPRGKQAWRSDLHAIWYERAIGIWQSVWLENVPKAHISRLDWHTDAANGTVSATVLLSVDPPPGTELTVDLRLGEEELANVRVRALDRRIELQADVPALRNPHEAGRLEWSPEHPVLVDAAIELRTADGAVDTVSSYLGIRTVAVGHRAFLLNRRPSFVRAVLEQGYWPDGLWTAPSVDALRAEVELILALGFTTVRIHQKVEDPRFLYWCDRLGLMVWGEIGAAYGFSPDAVDILTREWIESVQQRRSHPSVVVWVPFNESWGVNELATSDAQRDFVRGVVGITRALDPSRPVVSNDGWEHVASDLITIHDYDQRGDAVLVRYDSAQSLAGVYSSMGPGEHRVLLPGQVTEGVDGELPVLLSEFGGVAFADADSWGYGVVADVESFETSVSALFAAANRARMLAGYCYTQLTDTEQEANGLVRADRSPKLAIERLRAMIVDRGPSR